MAYTSSSENRLESTSAFVCINVTNLHQMRYSDTRLRSFSSVLPTSKSFALFSYIESSYKVSVCVGVKIKLI